MLEGLTVLENTVILQNPELRERSLNIRKFQLDIMSFQVKIAGQIRVINDKELYKADNFTTIHDYMQKCFNWERAARYQYLRVGKMFTDENGEVLPEFKDFNFSMLYRLSEAGSTEAAKAILEAGYVTSEMSSRTIGNAVKKYNEEHKDGLDLDDDSLNVDNPLEGLKFGVPYPIKCTEVIDCFRIYDVTGTIDIKEIEPEYKRAFPSDLVKAISGLGLLELCTGQLEGIRWTRPIMVYEREDVATLTMYSKDYKDVILITLAR